MDMSRKVTRTLIAAAAIAGFFGAASPCDAEERGKGCGSTFVTLGAPLGTFLDLGLRAGLEYRSPAGPGVEVAVGTSFIPLFVGQLILTGEVLAVLPLFRFGRSGAFDLSLGVPTFTRCETGFPYSSLKVELASCTMDSGVFFGCLSGAGNW